jgi:hypothetical protein
MSTQPVTIDGKWTSPTEWTDAVEIQMPVGSTMANGAGYFRIKHDATNLYVLGESLVDTAVEYNAAAGGGDFMSVYLDPLYTQGTAPQTDDYRFTAMYLGPGNTTIMTLKGNGTAWQGIPPTQGVQGMVGLDTGNSPHAPYPHVVVEMSIPMSLLPASPFGLFIRLADSSIFVSESAQALAMLFYWPNGGAADQSVNPSTWGTVVVSSAPIPEFSSSPLIVTLAIFIVIVFARADRKNRYK